MQVEQDQKKSTSITKSVHQQHVEITDLLVAYLEQLGIKYIFGVPGGAIEPLYNALARSERRGGPRAVVARHETGAAFMAAGYANNSNRVGVCCSTTGPGATNLVTGVASAYENNIPMLVITPQTTLSNFGKKALQESSCTGIDTVGMFNYCTAYNSLISHVDQFENKLCAAIISAYQESKPVHLSIPLDLQRTQISSSKPAYNLKKMVNQPTNLINPESVRMLQDKILTSKKTVFVIGEDSCFAIKEILDIALLLNIEIVTTPHAKGLISPYHPLYRGIIGFAGHTTALETLADKAVDTIIAIGTVLSEWATNAWDSEVMLNERLIHVEAEKRHFIHSPMAGLHVLGDIKKIFSNMYVKILSSPEVRKLHKDTTSPQDVKPLINKENKEQYQFVMNQFEYRSETSKPIQPQCLMEKLPKIFPPYTRYIVDPGNSQTWAIHYLHPYDRRIRGHRNAKSGLFQSSLEFASMGWAIGSAIGAAIAKPDLPVVCITGDGSFLMSGQEITVAIQENLTVIFMILNDSALGMVKHGQRLAQAEQTAYELPEINYSEIAKSMGIPAYTIHSSQDLVDLDIEKICNHTGPTLLDIRIDGEEIPPMGMRMKVLGSIV